MARFDRSQKQAQTPQIARKPGKERRSVAQSTEEPSTGSQLQGMLGNRTMLTALTSDDAWNSLVEGALVLDDLGIQTPSADLLSNERMMGMLSEVGPGADPFSGELSVQAKGEEGEQGPSAGVLVNRAMGRGGRALPGDIRSEMESKFGADFSAVRIHTDGASGVASEAINARAFAVGADIYFNSGEFNPGSTEGKFLLAHELTHVVQGGLAPAAKAKLGGVSVSSPSDPHEKEADAVAMEVVRGSAGVALGRLGGGTLGRDPERSVKRFAGASLPSGLNRKPQAASPTAAGGTPTVDLLQTRDLSSVFTTQQQAGAQQQSGATGAGTQQGGTPTGQDNVQGVNVRLGSMGSGTVNVRKDAQGNISGGTGTITLNGGIFSRAPTQIQLSVDGKGGVSGSAEVEGSTLTLGQLKADGKLTLKIDQGGFSGTGTLTATLGTLLTGELALMAGSDLSLVGTLKLAEGSPIPGTGALTVTQNSAGTTIGGAIHVAYGPLTGDLQGKKDGDNYSFGGDLTIATGGGSGTVTIAVTDQGAVSGTGKVLWPISENLQFDANASFDSSGEVSLDGKLDIGKLWNAEGVTASGTAKVNKAGEISGSLTLSADQVNLATGAIKTSGSLTLKLAPTGFSAEGELSATVGNLLSGNLTLQTGENLALTGSLALAEGSAFPGSGSLSFSHGAEGTTIDGSIDVAWGPLTGKLTGSKDGESWSLGGDLSVTTGGGSGSVTVKVTDQGLMSGSGKLQWPINGNLMLDADASFDAAGGLTLNGNLDIGKLWGAEGIVATGSVKVSKEGKPTGKFTLSAEQINLALGKIQTSGSVTLELTDTGFAGSGELDAKVGSLLSGKLSVSAGTDLTLAGSLALAEGSPFPGSGSLSVKHDKNGTKVDGAIDVAWGPLTGKFTGKKEGDSWSLGGKLAITTGGGSGSIDVTVTDAGLMSGSGKLNWPIDGNLTLDADASFDAAGGLTLNGKLDVGQVWGAKGVVASGVLKVNKEGQPSGSLTLSAEQVNIKGFSAQSGSVTVTFGEGTVDFAGALKMAWGTLATADISASSEGGKLSFEGDFKLNILGSHFDPESIKIKAADGAVTLDGEFGWTWNEKLKGSFKVNYNDGFSGSGSAEFQGGLNSGTVNVNASKEGKLSGSGTLSIKPFPWFGLDASVKVSEEGKIDIDKVGAKASIKLPGVKDGATVDVNGKLDDQSNFDGTIKIDVGSFTIPGVTFTGSGLTIGVHGGSADVESANLGVKTAIGEGTLDVKKEGDGLAFTTKIDLTLPKIKEATVELAFRPGDIIEGEAKARAELGGAKGAFDVHVKQEGAAGMKVWGEGSLEYKKGILDGSLQARLSKERKWSGEGKLAAKITKNLKADAEVEVSEEGKVKMAGEIALAKGLTLFEGKDKEFKSPEFSVSFPIFGFKIPFINVGVGITADISAGLNAKLGVKPAKIDEASLSANVEELGETPPVFELKGKASAGAYADLSLFVEGALSASAVIASLSGFLRMTGGLKAEADLSLAVDAKGSSPSDFVFDANAELKAGLKLHADVTAGVKAKIGWGWLSKSKEWSKSLAAWSYDTGQQLQCNAGVHYDQQQGVNVDFDYKAPNLDYKGMAENAAKKMM